MIKVNAQQNSLSLFHELRTIPFCANRSTRSQNVEFIVAFFFVITIFLELYAKYNLLIVFVLDFIYYAYNTQVLCVSINKKISTSIVQAPTRIRI